jgi:hypothetical protein
VVDDATAVVIDGYTRSASTFAVYAFQLAQERPVRMAHHLHAPAQLIAAAKAHLPTIAVIRDPRGAILSQLLREPNVALRDLLWAYTRFYSCLMQYRSQFVVADFAEITTDFGAVVRRLNSLFGTSYREFENSEANVQQCLSLMKERAKLPTLLLAFESGTATLDEALAALPRAQEGRHEEPDAWTPSDQRRRNKEALGELWTRRQLETARRRAEAVYERFLRGPGETQSVAGVR